MSTGRWITLIATVASTLAAAGCAGLASGRVQGDGAEVSTANLLVISVGGDCSVLVRRFAIQNDTDDAPIRHRLSSGEPPNATLEPDVLADRHGDGSGGVDPAAEPGEIHLSVHQQSDGLRSCDPEIRLYSLIATHGTVSAVPVRTGVKLDGLGERLPASSSDAVQANESVELRDDDGEDQKPPPPPPPPPAPEY